MDKIAVIGKTNEEKIKSRYKNRKEIIVFNPIVADFAGVLEYSAVFFLNGSESSVAPWVGNEHLRLAENEEQLFAELDFYFGLPQPLEIERKFLVEMPDLAALAALPLCRSVEIWQAYIKAENGTAVRLRKRGRDGVFVYIKTQKKRLSASERIEIESRITQAEFENGVKGFPVLSKTRWLIVSGGKCFELDIFPFWQNTAVLEIELKSANETFTLPPFLKVLEEVTDNKAYGNSAIAAKHGIIQN